jgi:hypothetical protein
MGLKRQSDPSCQMTECISDVCPRQAGLQPCGAPDEIAVFIRPSVRMDTATLRPPKIQCL